ncbi:MAG: CoA ester lyase [Thermaerobacter sp.]|nr:CoA ester lyase [Thermaerobacter sp.]
MAVRTWLYAPGDRPDRCLKALASPADQVIWDLEDAVTPDAKLAAREIIGELLRRPLARTPWIRINSMDTVWGEEDVRVLARAYEKVEPRIVVPKMNTGAAARLAELSGVVAHWLLIVETAQGLLDALHSPRPWSLPGAARLAFGALDYRNDIGAVEMEDESELTVPRSLLALVSRGWGWPGPIDAVLPDIEDPDRVERSARRGRSLGMAGKMIVHPAQIAPVHRAFGPTDDERVWAQEVLAAAGSAGAVKVRGAMVDRPIIEQARRILESAEENG